MNMTPQEYQQYVKQKAPKSPLLKDTVLAFVVGGAICVVGQLILNGWTAAGLEEKTAGTATSCTLVFLSALLTGLNLYNKLARFGGAGTLVPITGFANAVVSPAIDFRSEGFVTGMAAKMFLIAGPVIVFGTGAARLKRECHAVPLWGCCTHRGFLYPKYIRSQKSEDRPGAVQPGRSGVSQLTGPSSKDRGGCSRHKRPWQSGPPPG